MKKWSELLEQRRARLVGLRRTRAQQESDYADVEMSVISHERSANPDMSQAAFDRHIKVVLNQDDTLRNGRAQIAASNWNIDSAEYEVAVARTHVETGVARMNELGGYFAYLAAIKHAETAQRHASLPASMGTSPTPPDSVWT